MGKTWDKVKDVLATGAPMIGTLIGGPGGAAVGAMVSSALGVENTPEAIEKELTANPDALLKVKELEVTHSVKLQELMLKQEETRTERHKADMLSDSWLSKNIRPMVLITVTLGLLVATFLKNIPPDKFMALCDLNQWVYGYYFLGRSTEKVGGIGPVLSAIKGK